MSRIILNRLHFELTQNIPYFSHMGEVWSVVRILEKTGHVIIDICSFVTTCHVSHSESDLGAKLPAARAICSLFSKFLQYLHTRLLP